MIINSDFPIDDLSLFKHLKKVDSPFLPFIKEVYEQNKEILNTRVPHIFPNYTLHNTGHSFRIIEYMSKLILDCAKLNELEITLLIYSALFHDIGMAVSDEDVELIKTDSFPFCDVKFSAMLKVMGNDENLALQEYVRRIHSSLSGRYVKEQLKDKFVIPRMVALNFTNELALICESHTKGYDWIKSNLSSNEVRGDYSFNSQFISIILRLADLLDIDSNRTPYNLYKLIAPKGFSDDEWKKHFLILNNEKIVENEKTKQKKIIFHGKATNASIHRKILKYIDWVKIELTNAVTLVNGMQSQYSLIYDTTPEINIQTEGYTFSDYKMTLEYRAISSLLMGEKIYGSKVLGLRELIQNSIDSCRIRQESEEEKYEFGQDKYVPKIKVILDQEKNQVIIKDNGTGMSKDIIKNHFLNIGVSYYNSEDFLLRDFNYKPIGNFGIGFLSCFMLSDEVKVITRHYKSKNKFIIELEKGNEYTSLTESEDVVFDGTEVILSFINFFDLFENNSLKIKEFLNQYFLTDGIVFELVDKSGVEILQISNPINYSKVLEKGYFKIEFKKYIKDFDGFAIIKNKSPFVRKFEDFNLTENLYRYTDEEGFIKVNLFNGLCIDDYLNDKEIKYLSIPIVTSEIEDDYLNGLNFTDDVDEVITKYDSDLTWISVIFPKDIQSNLIGSTIDSGEFILNDFGFEELIKIGHSPFCKTKTFVKTILLFEGRKNDLYLPFDNNINKSPWSFFYNNKLYSNNKGRKELFMRSVLIKDFMFDIPLSATVFEINSIVASINSRKFIPDISRNNVDITTKNLINYIIGKAIHLGACDVLCLTS